MKKKQSKNHFFGFVSGKSSALFHPGLVLWVVVLPQLAMLGLGFWDYGIIKHLLAEKEKGILMAFGGALAILLLLTLLFSIIFLYKKKRLPALWTPLLLLGAYGLWTFFFLYAQGSIEWWKIPAWMVDTDHVYIYPATFVSPAIFLGILQFVSILTPPDLSDRHILINFGLGLLMPLAVYLGFQIIDLVLSSSRLALQNVRIINYIAFLFFIGASLLFFFFSLRSFLLLARASFLQTPKAASLQQIFLRYLLPVPILLFPQLGLLFNNHGELIGLARFTYIFGNFSHPLFYLLAFATNLLLVLPAPKRPYLRGALFLGRVALFPFSLYFLIVFLPWLPLSILAILAAGAGFLMLTPLLIFYFHAKALWMDILFFKEFHLPRKKSAKAPLWIASALCILILPLSVYLDYSRNRQSLHRALDYVYAPEYGNAKQVEHIDRKRLLATLQRIRFFNKKSQTPYLDHFYRSVVLDGLALQDKKIKVLENIFFGKVHPLPKTGKKFGPMGTNTTRLRRTARFFPPSERGAVLQKVRVHSHLSKDRSYQISEVQFTVKNLKKGERQFRLHFRLPEDVFLKKHYLVIQGRREYGILAEKKSALWVYRRIVSRRRDPSILYYKNPSELVLQIFPVPEGKPRIAGFTLLYRRSFSIDLAGRKLHFSAPAGVQKKGPLSTPPAASQISLKIILDCSMHNPHRDLYLDFLVQQQKGGQKAPLAYCVDFQLRPIFAKDIKKRSHTNRYSLNKQDFPSNRGGFFLGRALSEIFFQSHQENETKRQAARKKGQPFVRSVPRILVLGPPPSEQRSVFVERHHAFRWIFGKETNLYYISFRPREGFAFQKYDFLEEHPFKNKYRKLVFLPRSAALRKLASFVGSPLAAFPRSFVYQSPEEIEETLSGGPANAYADGLQGLVLYRRLQLKPARPGLRRSVLQHGFQTKILNPALASLALENEAQKEALRRKQAQALAGHRGLDVGEEAPPMDEPSRIWLLLFLIIFILYKNRFFLQRKWQVFLHRT